MEEEESLFTPTFQQIAAEINQEHAYFPLALPMRIDKSHWFSLYKQVTAARTYHALLESGRVGSYSFMVYHPTHIIRGKNKACTITSLDDTGAELNQEIYEGPLLSVIKDWMKQRQSLRWEALPDYQGGLLGTISYDLVREIEDLPHTSRDDLHIEDICLMAFDQVLAYDHRQGQCWLIVQQAHEQGRLDLSYERAKERLVRWQEAIQALLNHIEGNREGVALTDSSSVESAQLHTTGRIEPSLTQEAFEQAVRKIQAYIEAGDVFQVNLSVRQSRPLRSEPIEIYEQLREINPSPYMGFLHFPEMQVVSGSPEQLIKLQGREVNTRPIAGTRPRGSNREKDLALAKELINNEKERAEHVMLVDLQRNDIGKVCQYGSVHVDEFMVIEEYSHVMHIVSNVKGRLWDQADAFDVIGAVFPGGTITGAPKVRTMEIIEEMEPVRRGLYTGSIGWMAYNGDMELNIAIRTMVIKDNVTYVQAGAGIVIDSIPHKEYIESLNKALALWRAYEQSITEKRRALT
jgi:para-aminobenzoate synthetase component 1